MTWVHSPPFRLKQVLDLDKRGIRVGSCPAGLVQSDLQLHHLHSVAGDRCFQGGVAEGGLVSLAGSMTGASPMGDRYGLGGRLFVEDPGASSSNLGS